jgi:hypothetical protein
VGGIERGGDLGGQAHGLIDSLRSLKRTAINVFEHQVVRADVVNLADVRMIDRGDGAGFPHEARAMSFVQALDSDDTVEPRIAGLPDLTHAACTNGREDFVGTEFVAY